MSGLGRNVGRNPRPLNTQSSTILHNKIDKLEAEVLGLKKTKTVQRDHIFEQEFENRNLRKTTDNLHLKITSLKKEIGEIGEDRDTTIRDLKEEFRREQRLTKKNHEKRVKELEESLIMIRQQKNHFKNGVKTLYSPSVA